MKARNQLQKKELNVVKSIRSKQKTTPVTHLAELFKTKLKTLYWLERELVKVIPKVIKNTRSIELVSALEIHLVVTKDQTKRLDAIFKSINVFPERQKCASASGLIKQLNDEFDSTAETMVRDAGIIVSMQQIIHHTIVLYDSLCSFAKIFNEYEAAALLADAMEEEKKTDIDLSQIAETFINPAAAGVYRHDNVVTLQSKILFN
ncbi:MAG: ferritin-like domain-containing protein [Bacteroidia bacterium]